MTVSDAPSFLEYEAEAWETRSHVSDDRRSGVSESRSRSRLGVGGAGTARRSPSPLSQQVDYYQNTNTLNPSLSHKALSQMGGSVPQLPAMGGGLGFGSQFGGSQAGGSDHGMGMAGMNMGMGMGMPGQMGFHPASLMNQTTGSMSMHMGMPGYAGSMFMPQMAPRNSVMTGLNMYPGAEGGTPGAAPGMNTGFRPMSTFSMSPTANPFPSGPNQNSNPSDEELLGVLRTYLGTQDLMSVTKK